jgi:hypothetical protein
MWNFRLPDAPISAVTASVAALRAAVEWVTAIVYPSYQFILLDLAGLGTLDFNGEPELAGFSLKLSH